jgi:hypothetical protein
MSDEHPIEHLACGSWGRPSLKQGSRRQILWEGMPCPDDDNWLYSFLPHGKHIICSCRLLIGMDPLQWDKFDPETLKQKTHILLQHCLATIWSWVWRKVASKCSLNYTTHLQLESFYKWEGGWCVWPIQDQMILSFLLFCSAVLSQTLVFPTPSSIVCVVSLIYLIELVCLSFNEIWHQWLIPVIQSTWEAETRRITVQQPTQITCETVSPK